MHYCFDVQWFVCAIMDIVDAGVIESFRIVSGDIKYVFPAPFYQLS